MVNEREVKKAGNAENKRKVPKTLLGISGPGQSGCGGDSGIHTYFR